MKEPLVFQPPPLPEPLPRAPFVPPEPPFRKLRGYAIDPSLDTDLATKPISTVTFRVPWEKDLEPGPCGEYLEVIDADPASGCYYQPVDLNHPALLAQDGLAPSEGTPQFHQQMVYAVASLTINNFEHALGRRTLWRHEANPAKEFDDTRFCRRLRIYPHALRESNAYYTPQRIALLFGYFRASSDDPGDHMGGSMVFACLSHDIVAHETTHALLDGMNRNFLNPSNPDVHAFHEAFADIVALFQHFTFPEILRHQILETRGDIASQESLLSQLAGQFGHGTGRRGALRKYIGVEPNPADYQSPDNPVFQEPHNRGALLVAAVFEAFLSIYNRRTADLLRLATGGTGILQPGAIHPDLAQRLADEAAKAARHVLTMCVRAIDYCPPVDITFGEFLRAVITADLDVVADDDLCYRVAFIQAFRRRGIYPHSVRTLSVESLAWRGPLNDEARPSEDLLKGLKKIREQSEPQSPAKAKGRRKRSPHDYIAQTIDVKSREELFYTELNLRIDIHGWLADHFKNHDAAGRDAAYLGIDTSRPFEVRTARIAFRTTPDGGAVPQLIISLYQYKDLPVDATLPKGPQMRFEGGSTIIADLHTSTIKYCIRKSLGSATRTAQQRGFANDTSSLRATYFGVDDHVEPIAAIHRC